mmetsp:Transcript_42603/g.97732  ORF Transcript_42603/g.97732 Transcript_42603/m.97732 type:complete len:319 (-) Transcript_42603:138-1094(-)
MGGLPSAVSSSASACCSSRRSREDEGRFVYTALTAIEMPAGACGVVIFPDSQELLSPWRLVQMMQSCDKDVTDILANLLQEFAMLSRADNPVESLLPLVENYRYQFVKHNIHLFLSSKEEHLMEQLRRTTWLTFVDRSIDAGYIPPDVVVRRKHDNAVVACQEQDPVKALDMPDFSGRWQCNGLVGDMEAFMKEGGYRYWHRKLASFANHGVGERVECVEQQGCTMRLWNDGLDYRMEFHIGFGPHEATHLLDGSKVQVDARWVENSTGTVDLLLNSTSHEGGHLPITLRYMVNEEMVVRQTSPGGNSIQRTFIRKGR